MKKYLCFFLVLFLSFNIFGFDFDLSGSFNYLRTSYTGNASSSVQSDIPFTSNNDSIGLTFGTDICFLDWLGIYARLGFSSITNAERIFNNVAYNNKIASNNSYGINFDLGTVFSLPLGKGFNFCFAPAFEMSYIEYYYYNLKSIYSSRACINSLLGYGVSGDLYFKFRHGHFLAMVGCAGSVLPFTMVTSYDTALDYKSNISNAIGYNIRPYIAAGVTF